MYDVLCGIDVFEVFPNKIRITKQTKHTIKQKGRNQYKI